MGEFGLDSVVNNVTDAASSWTIAERVAYISFAYQKVHLNPGQVWDTEQVVPDQF